MGYMQAQGMAEAAAEGTINLDQALSYHLTANHYPPVPTEMVPVCRIAIARAQDDEWDAEVNLPEGITYQDQPTAPVWAIVEQHHLAAFIETEEAI